MRGGADRLVARYREARSDPDQVVLEGLHVLKHAWRFGAEVRHAATPDPPSLRALARRLAPDLLDRLNDVEGVAPELFRRLAPVPPPTGVLGLARRPGRRWPLPGGAPSVLLEAPGDLGNIGAVVRVAAAADSAAVLTTGAHDPWHPTAVRGAAGLHFALPVLHVAEASEIAGPIVAFDAAGEPLGARALPAGAVLAFGCERDGLSAGLLARAEHRLAIPMRPGVSSLNLATAVAVALYAWRLQSRSATC